MVESPRINTRISLGNAIWWLVPIVFLFVLYADGLQTWFAQDDFAWLSLLRDVHSFHDVIHTLFAPAAQGTIRPWSERGFFLLFESLFGLDSLPFRICVFVTMTANLHAGRLDHPPDHRIVTPPALSPQCFGRPTRRW